MNKNFISFLCGVMCCTVALAQSNTATTAFSGCPGVYVAGYKNGTSCVAAPYSAYTIGTNGASTGLLFSLPSNTLELNGIGISRADNRGYAILFDRTGPNPIAECGFANVRLIRFGANGLYESLGTIPAPANGVVNTALGAVDANGNYYIGGFDLTTNQLVVGTIANLSSLPVGAASVPVSYSPLTTLCPAVYADWAVNPNNNNLLYSYGIYNDRANGGTTTSQKPTGTLMKFDLVARTVTCIGAQATNVFTDTSADNFAGVMFGADGYLYGVNVKDRNMYRIDTATGAIVNVGAIAGSGQLRGDLGSCASFVDQPVTTPFSCTPAAPSYVIGFKNGTNCTVAPYNVYTTSLTGTLSSTPLFTTPDTIEVNGIGISNADSRGYALWYRRDNNSGPNSCINDTVKLIRFGANGAVQLLGYIPQPSGYTIGTALGTMGTDGAYYFGANINGQLAVGRIANVAALGTGNGPLTITYRTVVNACGGRIFADWAFRPGIPNVLYTYGISINANNQVAGVVMTIDLNASTPNVVMNCVAGTETTGTFTNAAQDNMGGIMFGNDGFMYGVNVSNRRYYRINPTTGALTLVSTIPANGSGVPTADPMRTDLGSCAVLNTPPTPSAFNCSPSNTSYVISYKNGTNCTVAPNNVYTMDLAGNVSPTPLFTTADTIEVNALGISSVDNRGYGITFRRDNNSSPGSCVNDTLKFFRFGANGVTEILGYFVRPTNPGLDLSAALGAVDANGTYYFAAFANLQLYTAKIERTDTLTAQPNRVLDVIYRPVSITCFRNFSDWAINPLTNQLVSYGIYTNSAGQAAGSMVQLDLATSTLSCYGVENTTEFTNAGQDNMGGIMFGTDASMYAVNSYTRRFYRINPNTGVIQYISNIPYGSTPTIRTDMASCVSKPSLLPLGFEKPAVTSLGECKAELAWKVSGVEEGDAFVVEKSFDGINFTTLTTMKATTTGTNSYSVTDGKTGITNYYRIKGVSKNGDIKYSPVVRFLSSCGGKNNVTLFQNLLTGTKTVTGEVSLYKSQTVTATIYSATGVKVYGKTINATAGVSRFNYDISSLSKGVYLLQTVIGQERFTEKFIVQ